MEKNNKRNVLPGDLDNLSLKDHLNASFDIDKITVSEDLIARTLKAVRESESLEEQPKKNNKIKRFPVRRLVSAAAVILILFVGSYMFQNGLTGFEKDAQYSMDTGVAGESAANQGSADIYDTKTGDSAGVDGSTENNGDLDSSAADREDLTSDEKLNLYSTDVSEGTEQAEGGGSDSVINGKLFSVLYPVTFETVETFKISKNDGTKISVTKAGNKVNELYSILDGYPLTAGDAKEDDTKEEKTKESNTKKDTKASGAGENKNSWTYKAEIETTEKKDYTILIGDSVQVLTTNASADGTSGLYSVEDMDNLIKQLNDFFTSLQ